MTNTRRYTYDGSAEVEARIEHDQQLIAQEVVAAVVPEHFHALVLMGGYGRGEGGYTWHADEPAPYNDYDYFLVLKDMSRRKARLLQAQLQTLAHQLSEKVGVEVDLAVLRSESLHRLPFTLMHAEMQWGHRVIAGHPDVLADMPAMPFKSLGLGEFSRLMNNRGALLLLNAQSLAISDSCLSNESRATFFKYLNKAVLACGDALLAAHGIYHPSYIEKMQRIETIAELPVDDFIQLYSGALEQKFHPAPEQYNDENLEDWQDRITQCWLKTLKLFEDQRLGKDIADWDNYVMAEIPKGQLESSNPIRNMIITLRDFGINHTLRHPGWSLRYPRERVIAVLPGLLTRSSSVASMPVSMTNPLAMQAGEKWSVCVEHYLETWARYA